MADHLAARPSAFDCDIVRSVLRKEVAENRMTARERRQYARLLLHDLTELDEIDPDILDWIVAPGWAAAISWEPKKKFGAEIGGKEVACANFRNVA